LLVRLPLQVIVGKIGLVKLALSAAPGTMFGDQLSGLRKSPPIALVKKTSAAPARGPSKGKATAASVIQALFIRASFIFIRCYWFNLNLRKLHEEVSRKIGNFFLRQLN
jgi:hypothetical protein